MAQHRPRDGLPDAFGHGGGTGQTEAGGRRSGHQITLATGGTRVADRRSGQTTKTDGLSHFGVQGLAFLWGRRFRLPLTFSLLLRERASRFGIPECVRFDKDTPVRTRPGAVAPPNPRRNAPSASGNPGAEIASSRAAHPLVRSTRGPARETCWPPRYRSSCPPPCCVVRWRENHAHLLREDAGSRDPAQNRHPAVCACESSRIPPPRSSATVPTAVPGGENRERAVLVSRPCPHRAEQTAAPIATSAAAEPTRPAGIRPTETAEYRPAADSALAEALQSAPGAQAN